MDIDRLIRGIICYPYFILTPFSIPFYLFYPFYLFFLFTSSDLFISRSLIDRPLLVVDLLEVDRQLGSLKDPYKENICVRHLTKRSFIGAIDDVLRCYQLVIISLSYPLFGMLYLFIYVYSIIYSYTLYYTLVLRVLILYLHPQASILMNPTLSSRYLCLCYIFRWLFLHGHNRVIMVL